MAQETIESIYQHTLLADAAYLKWNDNRDFASELVRRGFTSAQTTEFLRRYEVVRHQENPLSGFAATLFRDRGHAV